MASSQRTTGEASNVAERVKETINSSFDKLFRVTEDGKYMPYVCLVCDEFLKPGNMSVLKVNVLARNQGMLSCTNNGTATPWNLVSDALAGCYTFTDYEAVLDADDPGGWIEQMLLSPRASCIHSPSDRRRIRGFTVCTTCKYHLEQGSMPKFAIANNYCVGSPPMCLSVLTEVERAWLTPVKTHGYCFSYTGGAQKQLKGSLSYYKVNMESIARGAMHFDVLGMNSNIVVLMYGYMTPEQQRIARQKNRMRTQELLVALEWLLQHNDEWRLRQIRLDTIREQLQNPLLIDNSKTVDSHEENNIESTESFQVFFPDGTMSETTGGQNNVEQFKQLVKEAQQCGYDLDFRCDLMREAVSDFKDNNLVNACLLQFPYGRGGMHEVRQKSDGSFTSRTDLGEYVQHLSKLSQPHFHHELFTLILYNLFMKQEMVRMASLNVRGKATAAALSEELTEEDVTHALGERVNGNDHAARAGTGGRFISAVDATTRAVPHTNEAAKRARRDGEAFQHKFGVASYFLTFTPDDDNSILMQIYADVLIDDNRPISSLTSAELAARAKERTQLRIKFPGISAFVFEMMLDIVVEEVIGWNMKNGCAKLDGGLFGIPDAFAAAIEEQGRRSCHAHIQVWVKQYNEWREGLHDRYQSRSAAQQICDMVDKVASTSFFQRSRCMGNLVGFPGAFPHPGCSVPELRRRPPVVVDDQELRFLRYEKGQASDSSTFARCPHCPMTWTSTELAESYLIYGANVPGVTEFPDKQSRRLKAMAVEQQKLDGNGTLDSCVIDATYNHHEHTAKSCFGKAKQKTTNRTTKKKKRGYECIECRYRLPQRKKPKTVVQDAGDTPVMWYLWDGSSMDRAIKEVCIRRNAYDAFQNVCCPAISHSKMTCNTNISAVMPGPIGHYTFKYLFKDTQDDDTEEYSRVVDVTTRILSKVRTHESDHLEATRRVLAASHAHQKTNILGPPLASYLTRNKTRFIFSHRTTWCPLRDLDSLLHGGQASAAVLHHNNTPFFLCIALHYLCRPRELEHLDAHDFFTRYEVVRCTTHNEGQLLDFHNGQFQHPSYNADADRFIQGVRPRNIEPLLKIFQYDFPDTMEFKGSLLNPISNINDAMERYSMLALLVFSSYRTLGDIQSEGSYTKRLRELESTGAFGDKAKSFLQNLQDARANCSRVAIKKDDLQRCTQPFKPAADSFDGENECEEEDVNPIGPEQLDQILNLLDMEGTTEGNPGSAMNSSSEGLPQSFSVESLRQKGVHQSGYEYLATMNLQQLSEDPIYLTTTLPGTEDTNDNTDDPEYFNNGTPPGQRDIINILLHRTTRRSRSFTNITRNAAHESVTVSEANGSVDSIFDWAKQAGLDSVQKRSFEMILGTFILTFYTDAAEEYGLPLGRGHRTGSLRFLDEKRKLERLVERIKRPTDQLICLLHGPGGSGKTTVIDLIMEYAREYCSYMSNFRFTSRTIVVTAMTGVAATILMGQTTCKAVYLNNKTLKSEHIEAWGPTRILIIDEVSFAGRRDFVKLHQNLRRLKQNLHLPYGGLSIIFSGDMRQLEPIRKHSLPVYEEHCPEFQDWVNCYLELKGMHRFKEDPAWGSLLFRFRNGEMTEEDIDTINKRVVMPGIVLPENIKYATYENRDRDAINAALFEERCKALHTLTGGARDSIMIFSDDLEVKNGRGVYVPFRNCSSFWETCGENDIIVPGTLGRMDPVLKVYYDCRVMLPFNKDVTKGQANGTQAVVKKVVLKPGVRPQTIKLGGDVPVAAVCASQVSHIVLQHCNDRVNPPTFSIKPLHYSFTAKVLKPRVLQVKGHEREKLQMKGNQLPMIVNNATTGHKLQGSGVDNLLVHSWSTVRNWIYVMLSRVKTRQGLFCRKPLPKNLKIFAVPEKLNRMMRKFKKHTPTYWSEEEYENLFTES